MSQKQECILAIETSCDETAAAVVAGGTDVLSSIVASQVDLHSKFGGVVPEIASRKHLELINPVILEALDQARMALSEMAAVAVTFGPGLVGALLIGVSTAKALAYAAKLPLVPVNHLEGHILANSLEHKDIKPPFICLIVSGGHTSLALVQEGMKYRVLGETLDDAAGEAFDKIAGFLNLGYPGGPMIDRIARDGNDKAVELPRAMMHLKNFDFSFSGLKTAVLNYVARERSKQRTINIPDLCASFQSAVIEVLVSKALRAAKENGIEQLALAGGVAANSRLREQFAKACRKEGHRLFYPSVSLCTDNAVMIACAGYYRYQAGERMSLDAYPDPNLRLPA